MDQNIRSRFKKESYYVPDSDYDENLPFGGKVFVARKKKPDPWYILLMEITAVIAVSSLCFYTYFYFDNFHFHVHRFYAHLGYPHAQHILGQKYLQGHGTEQNHTLAFHWLKKASDQGHPHAAYNLAIGHLEGLHSHLKEGEAHTLIKHAATHGVPEAKDTLETACYRGDCDA